MSRLNAPLPCLTSPIPFEAWLRTLDSICESRLSIPLDDLPDLPTRAAYDSGIGPALFFEETVLPSLRESDVFFADALAFDESGDGNVLDAPEED